ncbi:MAG: type II toxin-antitoxin system HicB family antitoxin [bacterium]|nr:type II toxin-antitoxin system HicB family antitoxin [bacterium]
MRYEYAIFIERSKSRYWASVPDLPGCVSCGKSLEELQKNIQEAIEFHLEGMVEDGLPIPKPVTKASMVEVERPTRRKAIRRITRTTVRGHE